MAHFLGKIIMKTMVVMDYRTLLLLVYLTLLPCAASVTVYYPVAQSQLMLEASMATLTAPGSQYTGLPAYNPVILQPPAPPGPSALPPQFAIALQNAVPQAASIPLNGSFMGFSVEMSVANQVFGRNASFIEVPFLNLMANLQARIGRIDIRVGGNTQETATLVNSTSDGKILEKDHSRVTNPTQTPPLVFTAELLYMLRNISSMVNVRWHLGVPFNDTSNFRFQIIEQGQAILGEYLIGLQVGNEPDLYPDHGHRPQSYSPANYTAEFGMAIAAMNQDPLISDHVRRLLIGPSIQVFWKPEDVWSTGFIQDYTENLAILAVERYPSDNCAVAFPLSGGIVHDPQQTFPSYLTHASVVSLVSEYIPSTILAQQSGKPFMMFETNTASCGGFPGISDSFGAALWGVDYALQMAAANFSGALFHVGGQSVSYNPFTPPPTNRSTFHKWSVGPIYYSALVVAEALGPSNASQVVDLQANGNNQFSPAYGIWEHGKLARVVLINFATDSTGASDLNVTLSMDGQGLPNSVQVKYLSAPSVSTKGNIRWANQTFGGFFESDGRPVGDEVIQTVTCNPGATTPLPPTTDGTTTTGNTVTGNTCTIKVPAPAIALVFLNTTGTAVNNAAAASTTFATTSYTRTHNTATVPATLLATSNGRGGRSFQRLGSTAPLKTRKSSAAVAQARFDLSALFWALVLLGFILNL